jgi:HemY protein
MLRLAVFLILIAAAAAGLAWLADRPGEMLINWEGYEVRTSVFHAIVALAILLAVVILLWSILRGIWQSPASIGNYFNRRREKRGLEALSSGMIAIGAGDKSLATRYAIQARKSLPNEPMTHLLRAQAARLAGDEGTARRIFEAMLSSPDTEQLGLRGLFVEAEREGEPEAAKQFAQRAIKLNPKLSWAVDALFDIQCRQHDWAGALDTLAIARKNGHIEKQAADRKRAVLLTAQAQAAEDNDPERAMNLALEAHGLAVDLIPAAAIAGRLLASRGNTGKATKVISKTWKKAPHPELAVAYAYARLGDSPKDRMQRVSQLIATSPHVIESPIALANAAIEARDFAAARKALEPLIENRLTQRVCTLMARIEGEEGNTGGVREWLARAVNAPRDPAWTADGVVSDEWAPVSPVTGALDAFQWRVPVEAAEPRDSELLAQKIEELVALGARPETMLAAGAAVASAAATETATDEVKTAPSEAEAAAAAPVARARDAVDAEVVEVPASPAKDAPRREAPAAETATSAAAESKAAVSDTAAAKVASVAKTEPEPAVSGSEAKKDAAEPAAMKSDTAVGQQPSVGSTEAKTAAVAVETPAEAMEKVAAQGSKTGAGATATPNGTSGRPASVGRVIAHGEMHASKKPDGGGGDKVAANASSDGKPEPKIFVSPRAPDDPGPREDRKKA